MERNELDAIVMAAFATAKGPARAQDPDHCDECAEADRLLLDLDPCDLAIGDLEDASRNWIFSFATDVSLRWLMPGTIRAVLDCGSPDPSLVFDLLSQRPSLFNQEQRLALLEFRDFCYENGWMSSEERDAAGPWLHHI